jgi:hypothetical protein
MHQAVFGSAVVAVGLLGLRFSLDVSVSAVAVVLGGAAIATAVWHLIAT